MLRIDGAGVASAAAPAVPGASAEAGAFGAVLGRVGGPAAAAPPAAPAAAAVLLPVLPDPARNRRARERGQALLGGLARLHAAMLEAAEAGEATAAIGALLGEPEAADDPALAGLCRAIELRARVELARRER